MKEQTGTPKCRTCGKEASQLGNLFTLFSTALDISQGKGYQCGKCFRMTLEVDKEYVVDQSFIGEKDYEEERRFNESEA